MKGEFVERSQDPTELTRQALWREIESLKELVFARLDAIEQSITLSHDDMVRVPTEVQKAVGTLKELHAEKFMAICDEMKARDYLRDEKIAHIHSLFAERDVRVAQSSMETKTAVEAALQSAKEAAAKQNETFAHSIAKSETATVKQIDQQASQM